MDCPICGYKNLPLSVKFCTECNANIAQVSKPPDVQIHISQVLRNSEAIGMKANAINAETFIINSQCKLDTFKDNFCSLIEWIFYNSNSCSIRQLPSAYGKEILQVINQVKKVKNNNSKYDYSDFEIKVLDIVFNFCHYHLNRAKCRSKEFNNFTTIDFYSHIENLIKSGERIRVSNIRLSFLIHTDDERMFELVQALEKDK